MDALVKQAAKFTAVITAAIVIALLAMHKLPWAFGFLIGALWSVANMLVTVQLLKIAILKKDKSRLTVLLLVKFPLLYVGGAFILLSRAFPVSGILAGLAPLVLVIGALKICRPSFRT